MNSLISKVIDFIKCIFATLNTQQIIVDEGNLFLVYQKFAYQ
jgi:hypothetical protein